MSEGCHAIITFYNVLPLNLVCVTQRQGIKTQHLKDFPQGCSRIKADEHILYSCCYDTIDEKNYLRDKGLIFTHRLRGPNVHKSLQQRY